MPNTMTRSCLLEPTTGGGTHRSFRLEGTTGSGGDWRPALVVHRQAPSGGGASRPVLYIHGATFPSAVSVMFRFEGRSWADHLNAAAFDVFALDFAGYGDSERYPASVDLPGRAAVAVEQIERAVRVIQRETGAGRVSIIAHSWGTIAAGRFAGLHPDMVDRLVLFGPIAQRDGPLAPELPAWRDITVEAQHARFVCEVPPGAAAVLLTAEFPAWARSYLASDPTSTNRDPPSVRTPNGPSADIAQAWSGALPFDPGLIRAPTLIVRGEWDTLCTDQDAAWLAHALTGAAEVQDVKIPLATHLMHLETGRADLYQAAAGFLSPFPARSPSSS